ncbi:PLP-dependent aminotransferase family protein [Longispora albida]|uniref:MocR-like pyridoxine biosynthesis transcription factor PdxR n=1 Tax=Longispora albida TaxID=203523 RepID=UPI00035F7306|nr:PLP-dependent aminotransferase family protein [Longispora albida]
MLLNLDEQTGPRHARVASALRAAIRQGRLSPGASLPPSRQLAAELGYSRWVVTEAYAQLTAEGYLEARTGSATRVSTLWTDQAPMLVQPAPPPSPAEPRYDLLPGMPDLRAFPRARWTEALREASRTMTHHDLGYPVLADGGLPEVRRILTEYLVRNRGVTTAGTELRITSGVCDGLSQVFRALYRSGIRSVAVEDPSWQRPVRAARQCGLTVVPIGVDDEGILVEELFGRPEVRAVLATPAHQFPMGVVLSKRRRKALLDWLRQVGGVLLEDDYDTEFRYDRSPPPATQTLDPERVFLFGSTSKTLAPAVGVGWMLHPAAWSEALREANPVVASPSALAQTAFGHLVTTGAFDRHLRDSRRRLRRRRDTLVQALTEQLPRHRLSGIAAGLHIVVHLDGSSPVDVPAIVSETRAQGIRLCDLDTFRSEPDPERPGLVLGYGNLADAVVTEAVTRLAGHLASR